MASVVIAVASAALGFGAMAAGITTGLGIALAVASVAVGMVGSMIAKSKMPSYSDYTSQSDRKQVLRSSVASDVVIYGHCVVSGLLVFAEEEGGEQDNGEWLDLVLVICAHPVEKVGQIWLGEDKIEDFGVNAVWSVHNGVTECDTYLLNACPSWKEDMIGRDMCWIRISLKYDAELFPYGLPNIKMEVWGKKLYDPRLGVTQYSENAALVILDYYRSYLDVTDAEIYWDNIKSQANICGEAVTTPEGEMEQRYRLNGAFDLSETPTAVLDSMLLCCAATPVFIGGRFGLQVGAYYGPPELTITESQIIDTVQITAETELREATNAVYGTFIDPEQEYTQTDFTPVIMQNWINEDGYEIKEDLDLRFVNSPYQAARVANIYLRQKRCGRSVSVPMNMSGLGYIRGANVYLTMPTLGIEKAEFRIKENTFSIDGGVTLQLVEDDPDIWLDAIGQPFERPDFTKLPVNGVAMPDNLKYSAEMIGEVVQGILSWTNSGVIACNNVVIKKSGSVVYTVQVPGQSCRLSGLVVGSYTAEVRAVALNGAVSPVATIGFNIDVPPVPYAVDIETGNWSISLKPRFLSSSADGILCEYFFSTLNIPINEVLDKCKSLGFGASFVHSGLQPDTLYYYWIRSVNAYGKSALYAVQAKTSYDPASILAVLDNEIGAEHLREELRTQIAENTVAVETVTRAQADTAEDLYALWATKAQVGEHVAGFGLEVQMNDDGSIMSSFIVDADVFAILSRAEGDAGKIHPFVVKNGVVYINKAMMDSAEIAEVIAKYIRTDYLEGTEIVSPWIHSKAAPYTFELRDDGTLIAKKANITGTINATAGKFTGEVQASTGRFNNCIISESCTILGKVNAQNIDGDITQTYVLKLGVGLSITSAEFNRVISIPTVHISGGTKTSASGSDINIRAVVKIYINDVEELAVSASGYNVNVGSLTYDLPKGNTATVKMRIWYDGNESTSSLPWWGDLQSDTAVTMFVFKQ
ncbi:phage tail tip protein J-related protein [Salmonella enterica subsp. enterica]